MKLVQVTFLAVVLAVVLCVSVAFAQPQISVPLKIVYAGTDSLTDTQGYIFFGNDKRATFCGIDTIFHEGQNPPQPIGGNFDARFNDPRGVTDSCFDIGTWRDYRPWLITTHIDTFKIGLQPGPAAGTYAFSWPSGLGTYYQTLQLIDPFGGALVNVNMLTDTIKTGISQIITVLYIYATPIVNSIKRIDDAVPHQFALSQNYPNPFNPTTTIAFTVQKAVVAQLTVYDVLGRKVKTLASEHLIPGVYTTEWNGVDEHGNSVGSGVYYVRMVANDASSGQGVFSAVRKLMLAK